MKFIHALFRIFRPERLSPERRAYKEQNMPQFIGGPFDGSHFCHGSPHMHGWITTLDPNRTCWNQGEPGALYLWDGRNWLFERYVGRHEKWRNLMMSADEGA